MRYCNFTYCSEEVVYATLIREVDEVVGSHFCVVMFIVDSDAESSVDVNKELVEAKTL